MYTGVDYAGPLHVRPDHPLGAKCDRRFGSVYTPAVLREQYMLMLSLIFLVHPLLGHLEGSLPVEELHTE